MKEIDIGVEFSPYWKVESNMGREIREVSPRIESVYIGLHNRASLVITEDTVTISGGGFRRETTRGTKTFTDGKGNTVKVTKK